MWEGFPQESGRKIGLKKSFVFLLLLAVIAWTLPACAPHSEEPGGEESESTQPETEVGETPVTGTPSGYAAQFVCMSEAVGITFQNTVTRLFSSDKQFKSYSTSNFANGEVLVPGASDVFFNRFTQLPEVLEKYDATFFSEHYLVIIRIDEENDASRHQVTELEVREVRNVDRLCVTINRLPMVGGSEETKAHWYLFLEIDRGDLVLDAARDIHVEIVG